MWVPLRHGAISHRAPGPGAAGRDSREVTRSRVLRCPALHGSSWVPAQQHAARAHHFLLFPMMPSKTARNQGSTMPLKTPSSTLLRLQPWSATSARGLQTCRLIMLLVARHSFIFTILFFLLFFFYCFRPAPDHPSVCIRMLHHFQTRPSRK